MKTQTQISNWIKAYLADLLDIEVSEVDETYEFERFGLNSSAAVSLIGDLEEWLDYELSPSLFFEFSTIEQVSIYLADTLPTEQQSLSTINKL